MFLLAFCCFAADQQHQHYQPRALREWLPLSAPATFSGPALDVQDAHLQQGPPTWGSQKSHLQLFIPRSHVPFLQRCLIVGLFVRQDTISRTVLPLLWQHQHQWDFDHDVTVFSFQVTSKMFSIQTCTTKKFITMGNEKSFRDVQNRHILLSGSHWERSVFHCLLFNPAFSWGHPAGVEYRYFAIRGHLLYD